MQRLVLDYDNWSKTSIIYISLRHFECTVIKKKTFFMNQTNQKKHDLQRPSLLLIIEQCLVIVFQRSMVCNKTSNLSSKVEAVYIFIDSLSAERCNNLEAIEMQCYKEAWFNVQCVVVKPNNLIFFQFFQEWFTSSNEMKCIGLADVAIKLDFLGETMSIEGNSILFENILQFNGNGITYYSTIHFVI